MNSHLAQLCALEAPTSKYDNYGCVRYKRQRVCRGHRFSARSTDCEGGLFYRPNGEDCLTGVYRMALAADGHIAVRFEPDPARQDRPEYTC